MKTTHRFQHENIQGFKFGSTLYGQPRMFSIVYFIDGLLIDSGHNRMQKEVMEVLRPLPVDQMLLTHHHEDHSGNLGPLQQHFQSPSYASTACVEIMKKPPSISPAQWTSWGPAKANNQLVAKTGFIETPHYKFEIIDIPGHARDMIGLYEKNEGWFFSADLWVKEYIRYFMRPESMKQQIASIKKALKLDFNVLLCSHNPQLIGGKELLKQKLQFFENFYGQVVMYHNKGYAPKNIMKQMNLREVREVKFLTLGALSTLNMVKSVIRDEQTTKIIA